MNPIEKSRRAVNKTTIDAVHKAAEEAHAVGLCIVPPAEDGSKRPLPDPSGRWDEYKQKRATDDVFKQWYPGCSGIGIVTGHTSRHAECWDFDDRQTYERFRTEAAQCGLGEVVERMESGYLDQTPGDGMRWLVFAPDSVEQKDNVKLARRAKREDERAHAKDAVKVLIEMPRYAIVAPTNGRVHPSGKPYIRRRGSFETIATYSADEREALFALARSFDEIERTPAASISSKATTGSRPGDDFNAKATWEDLLEPRGWARLFTKGRQMYWRRPGKKIGLSATTNYQDNDLLHVFSTSTEFDADKSYTRFAAYTVLEHGGNFAAAANALAKQGYGQRDPLRTTSVRSDVSDHPIQSEYEESGGGIVWVREGRDRSFQTTKLTNFTARIVADVTLDDDVETTRVFEIEATLSGRVERFTIAAQQFESLRWVTDKLGARAIVQPGQMVAKRTAIAIQILSGEIPECRVFANTGWRRIGNDWVFLHAGGALGPHGPQTGIRVSLPRELSRYGFPDDQGTLQADFQTSLGLLVLAPARVTYPGLAAVYRAVIGGSDQSLHLQGLTGVFKTEVLALLMQHFGPSMDARHLPAAWSSTENRLELLASLAKDVILAIDDFVLPANATAQDRARLMAKADRVIRAQGNNSGRGRLGSDARMRPERPPRGLIASSGEETPAGASLRARMIVVEVRAGDIDEDILSLAQELAASGVYARALAGFITWLAPRLEEVQREFKTLREDARRRFESRHKRSSDVFAQLYATWAIMLRFGTEIEAITDAERTTIEAELLESIKSLIAEQEELQASADPIARFRDLIMAGLVAGKAHVASATLKGHCRPDNPEKWGWRQKTIGMDVTWHPQGDCIGWVDEAGLYLEPDVAFDVARRMGGDFSVTGETLMRRMADRKLLLTIDTRGGRRRLKVRKTLAGERRYVLHVSHSITGRLARECGPCGPCGPDANETVSDQDVAS